jgi:hypothetical protein
LYCSSGEKQALDYINTIQNRPDSGLPQSAAAPA